MRPGPAPAGISRQDALFVTDLRVDYGYGPVVDGMSLEVNRGEVVAIVGANGAGKTSTLRAIAGFVRSTGSVVYRGELSSLAPFRRARHGIVLVPDNRGLFGPLNVRDHLWLACEGRSRPDSEILEGVVDLFPVLGKRMRQQARSLSGGEQQMLTIARALMMKPKLLILDEPTLGLAPVVLEQISKALERLRQTTDITVLLGEQNVTFALPHADRVYVLEHARVVWEGAPVAFAAEMGTGYL